MSVWYLQLTDQRERWTMVHIDDDDDEWDQRSMKGHPPIASGSGRCDRLLQLINLYDGETGKKVIQLQVGGNQRIRRGESGSGLCGGGLPALQDGPIKWEYTAFYAEEP